MRPTVHNTPPAPAPPKGPWQAPMQWAANGQGTVAAPAGQAPTQWAAGSATPPADSRAGGQGAPDNIARTASAATPCADAAGGRCSSGQVDVRPGATPRASAAGGRPAWTGLRLACFLLPLCGLTLWLADRRLLPDRAVAAGRAALYGLCTAAVAAFLVAGLGGTWLWLWLLL